MGLSGRSESARTTGHVLDEGRTLPTHLGPHDLLEGGRAVLAMNRPPGPALSPSGVIRPGSKSVTASEPLPCHRTPRAKEVFASVIGAPSRSEMVNRKRLRCQTGLEMFCGDRPYSSRRASVGLTFEARHAGTKAAARDPAARTIAAAAIVAGSVAVTPNNCDWKRLPRAATQGSARATPAATMVTASRNTRRRGEARVATSARRIPISRVRRVTTNDITP